MKKRFGFAQVFHRSFTLAFILCLAAAAPAFSADTGIEIQSTLPGVKVFVEGVQKGVTTAVPFGTNSVLRIPAPPGTYGLKFEYPGYSFQPDIQVSVPRDGYAIHILTANPPRMVIEPLSVTGSWAVLKTGTIIVRSVPALANVDLDGKKIDQLTDMKISGVEAGRRRISVYSRSARALAVEFDLRPEATVVVAADFATRTISAKSTYLVEIDSTPQGVVVSADGADLGRTPASVYLEPGLRNLVFSGEGFQQAKRTIQVDAPARIAETMVPATSVPAPAAVQPAGGVSANAQTANTQPVVAQSAGPQPAVAQPANPQASTPQPQSQPAVPAAPSLPPAAAVVIGPAAQPAAPASSRYLERFGSLYPASEQAQAFEQAQRRRAEAAEAEADRTLSEYRIAPGQRLEVPEYLQRIDALERARNDMALRFDRDKAEGLRQAAALYDARAKALRDANPMEDWENAADLERRLAPLLSPIEKAKAEDLARYSALLDAEKNLRAGALAAAHEDAKAKFAAASYYVQGPAVTFQAGSYDRDGKLWSIKVISSEKDFPYVANFDYSILNEKDVGAAYREFAAALASGRLAARLEYSYSRMPGSPNLSVTIRRAALFDAAGGKTYASGGEPRPVFGVRADDLTTRLGMPRLLLESALPGTVAKLGGRVLGTCPVEIAVEEGTHRVAFVWDGYPYGGKEVEASVRFGESKTLRAGDDVAYLELEAVPKDALVYVDGALVSEPRPRLTLKAGELAIAVLAPDFKPWKTSVAVQSGVSSRLSFSGSPTLVSMALVPGGSFSMSSAEADSRPPHQVKVSSFLMGKTEVTQDQYRKVMGANPSVFGAEADAGARPVENLSWFDAIAFCNALSELEGFEKVYSIDGARVAADFSKSGYRLPTEAEWEFAARGGQVGKGTAFAGAEDASKVAWYEANSGGGTKPTASLSPNELGLHDMSGNVWEWCWDWYGPFDGQPRSEPTGPASGEAKAIRGGGWYNASAFSRIALGSAAKPETKDLGIGFRVVRRR